MIAPLAFAAALCCAMALAGTAMVRHRAQRWGFIDLPNERSLHARATPRGGGIALVVSIILTLALVASPAGLSGREAGIFAGTSALVALVGWRDDFRSLAPAVKFVAHLAAAACAVLAWGVFARLHVPGAGDLVFPGPVAVALTLLWIVGLVNAYNFMDGIDGIASGQGIAAGILWAWLCGGEQPLVTTIGILVAAASAGFLWHNRPPAGIFLGDAGSSFLGFTFAVLPLIAFNTTGDARLPLAGALVVAPFVFDTAYTFCRRVLRGENVVQAHRTHLYQRLVIGGWSHGRAALLYVTLGVASGATAVAWLHGTTAWVAAPVLAAMALLPLLVASVERPRDA